MATPTITFNSSTGSDTAASGAGPATAITGSGASLDGTTTIDLSADSPDLSGVATDGTHVIWVQTSSGRQFFKIVGVDDTADTVTTEAAAGVTESGRTWAIGGKRATWDDADSRNVFADAAAQWSIETETDQTLTSKISVTASGDSTNGFVQVGGASSVDRPVIEQTVNEQNIAIESGVDWYFIRNVKLTNSAASKGSAFGVTNVNADFGGWIWNCELGDATDQLQHACRRLSSGVEWRLANCLVHECISDGISQPAGGGLVETLGCKIVNNGGYGVDDQGTGKDTEFVTTIVAGNTSGGIRSTQEVRLQGCTIDNNGGDGLECERVELFYNNTITRNGGYGVNATGSTSVGYLDYNNFGTGSWANTSGATNGLTRGPNTLSVDPQFADADNFDFAPQSGSALINAALQEV